MSASLGAVLVKSQDFRRVWKTVTGQAGLLAGSNECHSHGNQSS